LSLTHGIAARLSARLLKRFGSPESVFCASLRQLEGCEVPAATAQAVFKKEAFQRAEKELAAIRAIPGCQLVNWSEPEYPQALLQIYDPPVLFYVRGDAQILNAPGLAAVGNRRPTLYGTQMADRLARDLAARGIVIVSGLARGIDAIAHQGTMTANGRAIGVLGTGIDVCYPKENFPIRNRIVAGMPLGAIIIEGAQYSGSPITARLAMEFGREVFGVPGNVTQAVSFAPNLLIKQGAKLVTCVEDVIEELPTPVRAALTKLEQPEAQQRNLLGGAVIDRQRTENLCAARRAQADGRPGGDCRS
jgi:DNA processing protein